MSDEIVSGPSGSGYPPDLVDLRLCGPDLRLQSDLSGPRRTLATRKILRFIGDGLLLIDQVSKSVLEVAGDKQTNEKTTSEQELTPPAPATAATNAAPEYLYLANRDSFIRGSKAEDGGNYHSTRNISTATDNRLMISFSPQPGLAFGLTEP
ncbi:MAG: hypothetical protein M1820_007962 [Bogoriella megaspora]|nr:MAG: hypothetical protein M1820_007962 [Bogoriella megaspora]